MTTASSSALLRPAVFNLAAVLTLLACTIAAPLRAQDKPNFAVRSNAPGMVVIDWAHAGPVGIGFRVDRKAPERSFYPAPHERTMQDLALTPGTDYEYRVCATDHAKQKEACADWKKVTTMASNTGAMTPSRRPPPVLWVETDRAAPGEAHLRWVTDSSFDFYQIRYGLITERPDRDTGIDRVGPSGYGGRWVLRNLQPGERYRVTVQGCRAPGVGRGFTSSCTGFPAPVEFHAAFGPPAKPVIALHREQVGPRRVALRWAVTGHWINGVRATKDGSILFDQPTRVAYWIDERVRPNTDFTYQVCVRNPAGDACSDPFVASGTPLAPTAPARLEIVRMPNVVANSSKVTDQVISVRTSSSNTPTLRFTWVNAPAPRYIPGRYLVIERQVRGPSSRDPLATIQASWVEVDRVSAGADPTRHFVTFPNIINLQTEYRVCAVAPGAGAGAKACSNVVNFR